MTLTTLSLRLEIAKRHIESARQYMLSLVENLSEDEWFWSPQPPVTHVAWQVGHLAMAQYGLTLFRQRGRQEVDAELMSGAFRKLFAKGSEPSATRADYPAPSEILDVLHGVHRQMLLELPGFDGDGLDEPVDPPHVAFSTRYGALLFAGDHEMLHAGQIGLLRRLMGKSPLR
ncbi:MAG TPA: DinB family protein [Pirellulaceae bacterium]|nr:DinB family protein [Pirellulaceae bacterium]